MKINTLNLITAVVFVTAVFAVSTIIGGKTPGKAALSATVGSPNPESIVERFLARDTSSAERAGLTDSAPETFHRCRALTREECAQLAVTRSALIEKTRESRESVILEIAPDASSSSAIESYSNSIMKGEIRLIRFVKVSIDGNDARVRAEIEADGKLLIRDFLVHKVNEWRLFEIGLPDSYPNFVPIANPGNDA